MINNEHTGSLNATRSCCYGSQRRPLPPKSLGGVYYALRGGNHVMHFRQSDWKKLVRGAIILVIRFMADLLRKYRGSVVIVVGRGGAEPIMFTTEPLYFRGRSAVNLITNLLHRGPLFCTYFA